jgi:hypothetical protein
MSKNENQQYYHDRARCEREAAASANDPAVANVHLEMAKAYERRIAHNNFSELAFVPEERMSLTVRA